MTVTADTAPIQYMLQGATATFAGGTDVITGTFTYDPASGSLDAVNLVVTGPVFPTTIGTPLSGGVLPTGMSDLSTQASNGFNWVFDFSFPLAQNSNPLDFVDINDVGLGSTSVTGDAVPVPSMSTPVQTWFGGEGLFTNASDWSPPGSPSGTATLVITAGKVKADKLTITNPTIQLGSSSSTPILVLTNTTLGANDQLHVQTTAFDPSEPRVRARIDAIGAVTQDGEVVVGTATVNLKQLFPAKLTVDIAANSSFTLASSASWFSNDGSKIVVKPTGDGATFVNNGDIEADGGKVIFDLPVTGNGSFKVDARSLKGTVEFKDSVSSGTTVDINAGTLKLDGPLAFHGTIDDFNADSTIELVKLPVTYIHCADGVLNVFDGMHEVAALTLAGLASTSQFEVKESGGSSYITLGSTAATASLVSATGSSNHQLLP